MTKKFELTTNTRIKFGRTLYQIKALVSFGKVKAGDLGGWVQKEENLSQDNTCWIFEDAEVFEDGRVIRGGEIWGGEIWGGVIWGGVIRGGVIRKSGDIIFITSIGSRVAPLTAYRVGKKIEVITGCFRGDISEFQKKVKDRHGKNEFAVEYGLAIKLIKLKLK